MNKQSCLTAFFCIACFTVLQAQHHQLHKLWQTDTLLKTPESVLYQAGYNFLFVSNIDGDPAVKDGKGSIGKLGLDGKIIQVDWVSGLDAPKGMGIFKDQLFVADVNQVVVIDISKGVVTKRIPVEGATFLNDISIDKQGMVYVSDTRQGKVFTIEDGKVSTWLENQKGPNGLLVQGNDVYVLNSGAVQRVSKDKQITTVADSLVNSTDGIEQVKGREFIVSCWAGAIYYVYADGRKELLIDTRAEKMNTADIGYDAQKRIVYVPTFSKNSVVAYHLQ